MRLFNSREKEYRNPTGAIPFETQLHLKIVLPRDLHCTGAIAIVKDDKFGDSDVYGMYWCGMVGDDHEQWECDVNVDHTGLYWYHFGMDTCYGRRYIMKGFAGEGFISESEHEPRFQLLVYEKDFETPSWLPGGIMYQIFPDRFYNSGTPKTGIYPDKKLHKKWNLIPDWKPDKNGLITNSDFFGGDLIGIKEKLHYLKSLGVTCIYLNPIFEAYSNHRYDTGDYEKIDPVLGNEEDFRELCEEAKYIEAMKIFEQLDATDEANYENCRKNLYNMASSDYKKNNYKKAYEKFSFLSDYKDSKEKANQSLYILAKLDYEKLDYKNALKKYDKIKGFKDVDEKIKKYSTLINLISAVGEDGTPAVWNAYNVKCPKCGADAEYIFEFRDNGQYNVGVKCSKEGSYVAKEGRFRIEGNVLYDAEYHDGIMHFKKMADIKKINKNVTDKEGKNISIEMTDPVNSKNKSTITIYGNIISDDTASLG